MLFTKKHSVNNEDKITVNASTITTFVGVDSRFEGALTTKSSIRIDGTVVGDIKSDGVVVLTKTGKIIGTVEAENMLIAGKITGNISIRDKVNVEPSGQIFGEVITRKFVIDEESIFQGNCIMNRDGKKIPVTPYPPKKEESSEKKEEKNTTKADGENKTSRTKKKNRSNRRTTAKKVIEKPEEVEIVEENKETKEKETVLSSVPEDVIERQKELDAEIEISDIDDLKNDEVKPEVKKAKPLNVEVEE